jgi:hypothetical protein
MEPVLEKALCKQAVFASRPLCLNRVLQFHEDAAYLRLQRSSDKKEPPDLLATVAVRSVSDESGSQAIQGECSHVSVKQRVPFFFSRPEDDACKQLLVVILEDLFAEAHRGEREHAQLEEKSTEKVLSDSANSEEDA